MLAPTPPSPTITHAQSRLLRETLLFGFVVIGMMVVGAVFLNGESDFVTKVLLWLKGYFG
jgi:hypothetical protein